MHSGGYLLLYLYQKAEIRQDIRTLLQSGSAITETAVTRFHFTGIDMGPGNTHGFEWEEEGKEFRYAGQLYDVISLYYTKAGISLTCISDSRETSLENAIACMPVPSGKNSSARHQLLLQLVSSCFTIQPQPPSCNSLQKAAVYGGHYQHGFSIAYTDILTPPPKPFFT